MRMSIKRLVKRAIDCVFGAMGLQVVKPCLDFDSRPTGHAEQRMVNALAAAFDAWREQTTIWPLARDADTEAAVARFYADYLESPFRDQGGGSRFNNLLWLHLIARASRPSVIVDSGTYRGASAWAFATALPGCPIYSFDVDLSSLARRVAGVTYVEQDWALHDLGGHDLANSLAYFDDHIDQGRRLREAADRGIARLVFDDDFPVTSFALMAHDGAALPKIAFILDEALDGIDAVTWIHRSREHRWPVDQTLMRGLRARIAAAERLPNTSLITGIHQTPYRLVLAQGRPDHRAAGGK